MEYQWTLEDIAKAILAYAIAHGCSIEEAKAAFCNDITHTN